MSQPGVLHVEVHFPQGTGVLFYDSSKVNVQELVKYVSEKTKFPTSVRVDQVVR
ncbi:MAG: hypothetical protein HYY02_13680 [Chloroflexi bacterium]|nr:hypothetical protein [Chloroflexota bacterium]